MSGLICTLAAYTQLVSAVPPGQSTLTTVYIVCLIVGGGLLVVSTVFGHDAEGDVDVSADAHLDLDTDLDADIDVDADVAGDVDVGADVDVDGHVDVDHAVEGFTLATWFSIRFLVYFMATFGLIGTVLSYTTSLSMWAVLGAAVGSGLVVGQTVHQTLRYLRRTSGDSAPVTGDFLNQGARVTLAVSPEQCGEVAIQIRGRERFVRAVPQRPDDHFNVGDRVVVVTYANGTAEVISKQEYDFLHEHESGGDS